MKPSITQKLIFLIAILLILAPDYILASGQIITGLVTDSQNNPIQGASVIITQNDSFLKGIPTNIYGRFYIKLSGRILNSPKIEVSSIGYIAVDKPLVFNSDSTSVDFCLLEQIIKVGRIAVTTENEIEETFVSISREKVEESSRHSLVPTNPISAIKQPQIIREGSNHSSKIRSSGTSPTYFINGIEIGYDPNHYGMFSIIPGPVVKELKFHPRGTSAELALPTAIEINTPRPFTKHSRGEINVSSVEATGSVSIGNKEYFVIGTLRKSVLDKLIRQFEVHSERRTVPPTNFQDIFSSAGWKISPNIYLLVDQYYVRDFLSYGIASTSNNAQGINTFQHTEESFLGVRLELINPILMLKINAGMRSSYENYCANPAERNGGSGFQVNLEGERKIYLANVKTALLFGKYQLTVGSDFKNITFRKINLTQTNWNFLSPDARSDNLYIYQNDLNREYGRYSSLDNELNSSGFVSLKHTLEDIEIESGLRSEYFSSLSKKWHLVYRNALRFKIGDRGNLELYHGTFAENPTNRLLEPYQVLIHANLGRLEPVRTRLTAVNYSRGPLKIGVFYKTINKLPIIKPDFSKVNADYTVDGHFIVISSEGQSTFSGGDISLDLKKFISDRIGFYTYYSFTNSRKTITNITIPYDLDSPHRMFVQLDYRLNRTIKLGGEVAVRSGYPFTPVRRVSTDRLENIYTHDYYLAELKKENFSRFPVNATFNLYIDMDFGNTTLFLSASNISNNGNPVVNTNNGFIYDAGILPSIGLKHIF